MWSYLWDQSRDSKCSILENGSTPWIFTKYWSPMDDIGVVLWMIPMPWLDHLDLTLGLGPGAFASSTCWPRHAQTDSPFEKLGWRCLMVEVCWSSFWQCCVVDTRSPKNIVTKSSYESCGNCNASTFLKLCVMPTSAPFCALESNSPRQLFDLFEVFDEILELGLFEVFLVFQVVLVRVVWPVWPSKPGKPGKPGKPPITPRRCVSFLVATPTVPTEYRPLALVDLVDQGLCNAKCHGAIRPSWSLMERFPFFVFFVFFDVLCVLCACLFPFGACAFVCEICLCFWFCLAYLQQIFPPASLDFWQMAL